MYLEKGGYFGHFTVSNPALSQNSLYWDRRRHKNVDIRPELLKSRHDLDLNPKHGEQNAIPDFLLSLEMFYLMNIGICISLAAGEFLRT